MGISISGHAGVFIRITTTPDTYEDIVRTCPNTTCSKHGRYFERTMSFCSGCGTEITTTGVERETTRGWHAFVGHYDEARPKPKYDVVPGGSGVTSCIDDMMLIHNFVPNALTETLISNKSDNSLEWDPTDSNILSLSELEAHREEDEIAFEGEHKDLLEAMYDFFGDDNIVIDYGVLVWYS